MKIPKDLKISLESDIKKLNEKLFDTVLCYYKSRFSGKFLYLDFVEDNKTEKRCRLTYNGNLNDWGFAIFKWSSEKYDDDEMFFPGAEELDGTIEGAMKAGSIAY
jgi:uncharacterized protein YhdP